MIKRNLLYAISLIVLASCNNPSNEEPISMFNMDSACFSYANDSNEVLLHITIEDNIATGELLYNLYEKDKNVGTIKGEMKGDTLVAQYTFMSEGIESVREVVFLKAGSDWKEGFGEVLEETGKVFFKNKNNLDFENNIILTPITCNLDKNGSLQFSNYAWSKLKETNISLSETATILNPIKVKNMNPGYVLFSTDLTQAELFLPDNNSSILLNRKGEEGNYVWSDDDYELFTYKGYVLKKNKETIYGGE